MDLFPADQSDLDWLAFRYVAGEMSADEAAIFEVKLAVDQDAREAVSRAVALTERLAEAAPAVTLNLASPVADQPRPQSVWRRSFVRATQPLAWMAAGAAATFLIVNLSPWPVRPPIERGPGTPPPAAAGSRPAADAALWARLQAGGDWASPDLARWLEDSTASATEERDDALEPAEVPSWIFATAHSRPK